MSFIRLNSEERTGFQEASPYSGKIDVGADFVMVYGSDDSTPERVAEFRRQGYTVHLMTGIAWGGYQDYLYGKVDGREHFDEGQRDRGGREIAHGHDIPYMVPTIAFSDYLTEKLKAAVDAGVEAIHVEEPEFWDRGGYSEAFKREYLLYYREPWQPPHESADAAYRCAKLKSYLYRRAIDRVGSSLKEYALIKYNRALRFYVPTHSLVNYTQWKIISPEGALTDVPALDGYIAQIWTGTSRSENIYAGARRERTFETAYLEYGVMQELIRGTGREMWFLHDPIEDNPRYGWEDYEYNYLKTVTASLLHPAVAKYEVCPWPHRVYYGKYPSNSPDAAGIPDRYRTLLASLVQTLGDMPSSGEAECESGGGLRIGLLMSDTSLFQRTDVDDAPGMTKAAAERKRFRASGEFPDFYGLALPLLKRGAPVRPVVLDNARRYTGYLGDYDVLVCSYEFCKPESPDINGVLAEWVRSGGTLVYVGDGSDVYNAMRSWWTDAGYKNPAEHLFEALGIDGENGEISAVGGGFAAVYRVAPCDICKSAYAADKYRAFVKKAIKTAGLMWRETNALTVRRGKYIATAVMDESDGGALSFDGVFADMYTPDTAIITHKDVLPDGNALLCDLSRVSGPLAIIGSSARVKSMESDGRAIAMTVRAAEGLTAHIRLKTPRPVISAALSDGDAAFETEGVANTVLVTFTGTAKDASLTLEMSE